MRRLFSLLSVALLGLLLCSKTHADIIVEQETIAPTGVGKRIMKVRPGVVRMEQPSPSGNGTLVILCNLESDEMITLVPEQKLAMRKSISEQRAKLEQMERRSGVDPSTVKLEATGEKARIGAWDTEAYRLTVGTSLEMKVWVAKNFPNMQKYRNAMTLVSKAASGGALDPNTFDLPGMVIKSEMKSGPMTMSMTVLSIKEAIVPDSEYAVPEDYQPLNVPGAGMPGALPR